MIGAVVVVDNHTTGDAALPAAPGRGRVSPRRRLSDLSLDAWPTCRQPARRPAPLAALRGAAARSARTGRRPPAPTPSFPPGATGGGAAQDPWSPPASATRAWSARLGEGLRPGKRIFCRGSWASRRKPCGRGGAPSSTCVVPGSRGPFAPFGRRPRAAAASRKSGAFRRRLSSAQLRRSSGSGRWRPGATCWPARGRRLASGGPRAQRTEGRSAGALGENTTGRNSLLKRNVCERLAL